VIFHLKCVVIQLGMQLGLLLSKNVDIKQFQGKTAYNPLLGGYLLDS